MFSSKSLNEFKQIFYLINILLIRIKFATTETLKPLMIDSKGVVPSNLNHQYAQTQCIDKPYAKIGPVVDVKCKRDIIGFRVYWDPQINSNYCFIQAFRDDQIQYYLYTGVDVSGRTNRFARLNGLDGIVKFNISKIEDNRCGTQTEVNCPQPDYSKPQTIAPEEINTINTILNKIESSVFHSTRGTTTTMDLLVINDKVIMTNPSTKDPQIIPITGQSTSKEDNHLFPKTCIILLTIALIMLLIGFTYWKWIHNSKVKYEQVRALETDLTTIMTINYQ